MQEENMVPEGEAPEETPAAEPAAQIHDRELSCQNCGAPLAYMEGESVITCPYCGTTTMLAGYDNIVKIDSHSMLPMKVTENEAISALITWLSKGFHRSKSFVSSASVKSVKGLMLPYWIVKSTASTSWRARRSAPNSGNRRQQENGNLVGACQRPVQRRLHMA